jgi:hypothetical protein
MGVGTQGRAQGIGLDKSIERLEIVEILGGTGIREILNVPNCSKHVLGDFIKARKLSAVSGWRVRRE